MVHLSTVGLQPEKLSGAVITGLYGVVAFQRQMPETLFGEGKLLALLLERSYSHLVSYICSIRASSAPFHTSPLVPRALFSITVFLCFNIFYIIFLSLSPSILAQPFSGW